MKAITDKMRELARKKEEELLQRARDSDTLSTIVMPPITAADHDQLNRPTAPPRPEVLRQRGSDVDRVAGAPLRRVETALPAGTGSERPRVDRPASYGDESDDGGREVVGGGRPGQLRRWPAPSGLDQPAQGRNDDDDETSEDDDDNQSSDNNKRPARTVPPASSLQSTLTTTPDDSQTDSSLAIQKQLQNDLVVTDKDEKLIAGDQGRSNASRATLI